MDYFNPNFPQGGYKATHKGNSELSGHITPNFEIMEGQRFGAGNAGDVPVAFLPVIRWEPIFQDRIVIAAGTPVALASIAGQTIGLVPAGYRLLLADGASQGPQYTQEDAISGVLNAQGLPAVPGAYVVDAMIAAGVEVGACMGVASYDVYQRSGADVNNPATYYRHNYSRQSGVAVLTDYLLEFPIEPFQRIAHKIETTIAAASDELALAHNTVVPHTVQIRINGRRNVDFTFTNGTPDKLVWATAGYLQVGDKVEVTYLYEVTGTYQTPFKGMTTWRGAVKPGDFVTFNKDSKFVAFSLPTIGDTSAADESAAILAAIASTFDIVGQVTMVDYDFPKQLLDRVKTAYDDRLHASVVDARTGTINQLDKQPGSATDGAPHNVWFAGGDTKTGIVRFNMNIK